MGKSQATRVNATPTTAKTMVREEDQLTLTYQIIAAAMKRRSAMEKITSLSQGKCLRSCDLSL